MRRNSTAPGSGLVGKKAPPEPLPQSSRRCKCRGPMKLSFCIGVAVALSTVGCGGDSSSTDGGSGRVCTDSFTVLSVKVVDSKDVAVSGATVTAKNQASGKTLAGTTNTNGVTTAIGQDIGAGTVTVSAALGSSASAPSQVTWTCGECQCIAQPPSLTLKLTP